MGISNILRQLLEERNLTQKQLAADLRIPPSTIGGYFQGTSEPDLDTVCSLADYFGCSTDYLLSHKSPKHASLKEDRLVQIFRSMNPGQQDLAVDLCATISRHKK